MNSTVNYTTANDSNWHNSPEPKWGAALTYQEGLESGPLCSAEIMREPAPSEIEIATRASRGLYPDRYRLLRDLVVNLYWSNRFAFYLYDKRPIRWRDAPVGSDEVFLPVYIGWPAGELTDLISAGYHGLRPTCDAETEDILFEHLIALFRYKPSFGAELSAVRPTIREALANPANLILTIDNHSDNYKRITRDDIGGVTNPVPEIEGLMRQAMVLGNQYPWNTANSSLHPVGKLEPDDHVVLFYPKSRQALRRIQALRDKTGG